MASIERRNIERRQSERAHAHLPAELQVENVSGTHLVEVRNLSASGLMGVGSLAAKRGSKVKLAILGQEPIEGVVAWVQEDRFGVGFAQPLDESSLERMHVVAG